jgi:anthranilate phosphoribosyltransferase
MTLAAVIKKLIAREGLSDAEVTDCFNTICRGEADVLQISAFLVLLRAKGETASEVTALTRVMLEHSIPVSVPGPLLDIVGTGGDGANTVNISTSAAVLAAACGARVAKHGNRSVSSRSGSADVLEALGVPMLKPEHIPTCLDGAGIAFMYAPHFHPAMRHVGPVRKALGVRTVFNILGPLLNPAKAKRLMIGVFTPELLDLMGHVFLALGVEHALVVHCQGLDELTPMGAAQCVEVTQAGGVVPITIDPAEMGIPPCTVDDLKGGDCDENAEIIRSVFSGGDNAEGPIADAIALNAGAGMYVYGSAPSVAEGFAMAKRVLKEGGAATTLASFSQIATALHKE